MTCSHSKAPKRCFARAKDRSRREPGAMAFLKLFEALGHDGCALRIDVGEGAAQEGRKPEPEHRPEVTIPRRIQNAILQA